MVHLLDGASKVQSLIKMVEFSLSIRWSSLSLLICCFKVKVAHEPFVGHKKKLVCNGMIIVESNILVKK